MKALWIHPNGLHALYVTLASSLLGGAYFVYLTSESFPPDAVRGVPFIWLVLACAGLILGVQATAANVHRYLGVMSLILGVLNFPLAAIFTLGAIMGD